MDLFAAGAESTSNSIGQCYKSYNGKKKQVFILIICIIIIGFAILHLIHNQEAQRKMQEELDQVCGNSVPQLADRAR